MRTFCTLKQLERKKKMTFSPFGRRATQQKLQTTPQKGFMRYLSLQSRGRFIILRIVPGLSPFCSMLCSLRRFGADIPLTAVAWGVALTKMVELPIVTDAPLLAVGALLWCLTLNARLIRLWSPEQGESSNDERCHFASVALLFFAVLPASLWVLCCYVGQSFISYLILPALAAFPALFLPRRFGALLLGAALAMLCLAPAAYEGLCYTPLGVALSRNIFFLGILFFLGISLSEHLWSPSVLSLLSLLLTAASLWSLINSDPTEKELCMAIIIGAAWLQGVTRLARPWAEAAGALILLPPALLALLL